MAKRKYNKTLAIREHYQQNPSDKPKVIVEALKSKGIPTDSAYVSMILSKLRKNGDAPAAGTAKAAKAAKASAKASPKASAKGKKRRGRPAGSVKTPVVAVVSRAPRGQFGFDELNLAKQLVNQMGGASAAKQLIDALA